MMRHIVKPESPEQKTLFDPESCGWWHTGLAPEAYRRLEGGMEGVFRTSILKLMPVERVGQAFDEKIGRPSKELHAACGLLLLAEFRNWTVDQTADAWSFDASVQYALNLPRDRQNMSPRTVDNYRALLREEGLAQEVFETVTTEIVSKLELKITKQRLDSTHIFSDMAKFGRLKLVAVGIKRFLASLKRHEAQSYQALPEALATRYEGSQNRLFGMGSKQGVSHSESLAQAAEDIAELISRFEEQESVAKRSSYQAMVRIFSEHFEVTGEKIEVLPKAEDENGQSARVLQNPSDPHAGYDGHKGPGYQVQIAQAYDTPDDAPGIITACLPQSAAESDSAAVTLIAQQQARMATTPGALLADTAYGSQLNVDQSHACGVILLAPAGGKPRAPLPAQPQTKEPPTTTTLDRRRALEKTPSWQREYAKRSGGEGINEALDRTTRIKTLRVRGQAAVSMAVYFKVTGWNILTAAKIKRSRRKNPTNPRKLPEKSLPIARHSSRCAIKNPLRPSIRLTLCLQPRNRRSYPAKPSH
jgi:hypothetical protein